MLIDSSNGTKKDVIAKWNEFCNPAKLELIKLILSNYTDVKDKANDALDKYKDGKEQPKAAFGQNTKASGADILNRMKGLGNISQFNN